MRVALMLESDGPGGAERMLLHLAEGLRERGHHVVPVGPAKGCGWLAAEFRVRGFEPETFLLRRPLDWQCVLGLERLFKRAGVDVVHGHEFTMAVYGAKAAKRAGIPHLITMHGGRAYQERLRRRLALRWAARRSRALVAVSRATARELESSLWLTPASVEVIPNGVRFQPGDPVRLRRELGLDPDTRVILAVGNLYEVKGHRVLIRAAAELSTSLREPSWHVVIAGRGEEEPMLREMIAASGLEGRVTLLGYRQDVPDLLAAADIWVMPSLSEGMPLALVEAMFAGKAIVASDVGGIPEVVASEQEALLVPPSEAQALARALGRLLSDPALSARLGRAAREVAADRYDLDRMVDGYVRLMRGDTLPRDAGRP